MPSCVREHLIADLGSISKLAENSSEWIYLTTRSGVVSDPGYPRRLHDAISLIFDPYVERSLAGEDPDFGAMLRNVHRIVVSGKDGQSEYFGSSSSLRFEQIKRVAGISAKAGTFSDEILSRSRIYDWRTRFSIEKRLGGISPSTPPEIRAPVRITGIPSEYWPTLKWHGDEVRYRYPPVQGVKDYVAAMGSDMNRALELMREKQAPFTVLPYLADYVQKGVVGHIFNIGNYSIFMTQVNDLLLRLGFRGISPGLLDYHAMVEDSMSFHRRFISAVQARGRYP